MKNLFKKTLAILMAILVLNQVFFPCVAFALTSGPNSPEASSFEPIDTTDMVNPLTGDFTYNMPLLEVPGPEGGYPLSLSYHAGIQPNEEASWVGLGWSLNPGAITRNVNGYPDDFSDVNNVVRSYWSGGSTRTIGVNVGVGLGPASVNFGLSFSQDTYKGFGIGSSMGLGMTIFKNDNINVGLGVEYGVSPYGNSSFLSVNGGIGIGKAGTDGYKLGLGVSASTNFQSGITTGAGAGISYDSGKTSMSLLGASISSSGGGASFSVAGGTSSVNNANEGKIQTESSGFAFTIPGPGFSVGLSSNYTRYWSDETANVLTNGTLYGRTKIMNSSELNDTAYDTYRLLNPDKNNVVDNPDPDRLDGGTFPDFDNYSVSAQGLSGNMRPYNYNSVLFTQNKINNSDHNDDITARPVTHLENNSKISFRFINDFSNSIRQEMISPTIDQINFSSLVYGNNDGDFSYDSEQNKIAGSKDVIYFTNEQISNNTAKSKGFIDCVVAGFARATTPNYMQKQIGGFMITNASGITYHYALPAYSWNERVYSEKIDKSGGVVFNNLSKPSKYAYTWFLTAITGPDYVDRNENGLIDNLDWGYWISFEYGKWSDNYGWRNPSEGFHRDLDVGFQNFSSGKKDIYYLNLIKTRSHVAIFEKTSRADSKSVEDGYPSSTDNEKTISALKLNKIFLLNSNDYDQIISSKGVLNAIGTVVSNNTSQYYSNVIEDSDISSFYDEVKQKSIRIIKFNHDYSLSPGVPNSYDPNFDRYKTPSVNTSNYPRLGKLTLLSVENFGANELPIGPPTEFEYDLDPTSSKNQVSITFYNSSNNQLVVNDALKCKVGDLLKFSTGLSQFYCTILTLAGTVAKVKYIGAEPSNITGSYSAVITKNPPYHKDMFDMWGFFKSDYSSIIDNENVKRLRSSVSSKAVDAWSLRKINTTLGASINIKYDSDTYKKPALYIASILLVKSATPINGNQVKLEMEDTGFDLSEYLTVNAQVNLTGVLSHFFSTGSALMIMNNYKTQNGTVFENISYPQNKLKIIQVGTNYITIENSELYAKINTAKVTQSYSSFNQGTAYNISGQLFTNPITFNKPTWIGGNLQFNEDYITSGGDLRVESIAIDNDGSKRVTKYDYGFGTTSYEPFGLSKTNLNYGNRTSSHTERNAWVNKSEKDYLKNLHKGMNNLLAISREIPSPGVMYEYVTIRDEEIDVEGTVHAVAGKATYQYEVFNSNMLGKTIYSYSESGNNIVANIGIKDFTSRIGNLKRVITYDKSDNKLTEQINHYLHDPISDKSFTSQSISYESMLGNYSHQGMVKERYGDARTVKKSGTPTNITVTSSKEYYPSVNKGITKIDYRNHTAVKLENLTYDFYSGRITKTLTIDSYGNRFVNEVIPAYRKYSAMGLKVNESINGPRKHMLTQEASNTTYKVDAQKQKIGIISASIQTWGTDVPVIDPLGEPTSIGQSNIWRKNTSYAWMPNGATASNVTAIGDFQDFSFTGTNTASWKKTGQIKLYNVYSNALEAADVNNIASASKMGYNNTKVTLSGGPAKYDEIVCANAEDLFQKNGVGYFPGNIKLESGISTTNTAHTGAKSVSIGQGERTFTYTVPITKLDHTRNYIASVWIKPSSGLPEGKLYYQVNEGTEQMPTHTYQKQAGGWYLLEMTIPKVALASGSLKVGVKNMAASAMYADDFRFQPLDAATIAYVYNNRTGELTHVLDNNNLFTKYEYDASGRLVKVYKEILGKSNIPLIKEYSYNYGKMNRAVTTPQVPSVLYAKLFEYPITDVNHQESDFYIRLFSDIACTQQYVVTGNPMPINFRVREKDLTGSTSNPITDTYVTTMVAVGTYEAPLGTYVLMESIGPDWIERSLVLTPGSNYIIVN